MDHQRFIPTVTKLEQHNKLKAEIQAANNAMRMTVKDIEAILWLEEKPQQHNTNPK